MHPSVLEQINTNIQCSLRTDCCKEGKRSIKKKKKSLNCFLNRLSSNSLDYSLILTLTSRSTWCCSFSLLGDSMCILLLKISLTWDLLFSVLLISYHFPAPGVYWKFYLAFWVYANKIKIILYSIICVGFEKVIKASIWVQSSIFNWRSVFK